MNGENKMNLEQSELEKIKKFAESMSECTCEECGRPVILHQQESGRWTGSDTKELERSQEAA